MKSAAFALLFLCACGGPPEQRHWSLEIDRAFSVSDQQAINDAARSWERAVPVRFDVSAGCTTRSGSTCIESSTLDAVNAFCGTTGKTGCTAADGSKVLIANGFATWVGTVAHELGHVMGMHHSQSADDLMFPVTGGRDRPQHGDVMAWTALWE